VGNASEVTEYAPEGRGEESKVVIAVGAPLGTAVGSTGAETGRLSEQSELTGPKI